MPDSPKRHRPTLDVLGRWADQMSEGPPVAIPREVANFAELVLLRLERDPNLLLALGLTDYAHLPKVAGTRFAISRAIEACDRARSEETERR